MSYASDRERADRFIPQIKQIAGPHLLIATPDDIDCHQAADLMILKARDMTIGARVRKHEYLDRYRYQITIRAKRDSGAKTELAKIIDGWGDWLFYAFADLFDERIALWRLIDLDVFRADLIRNQELIKRGDGSNGDGTHFKWFDLRSFDPSILHRDQRTIAAIVSRNSDTTAGAAFEAARDRDAADRNAGDPVLMPIDLRVPPYWPDAWIALIDALRDYIAADEGVAQDLLDEGYMTQQQCDEAQQDLEPLRALLKKLESHEVNPSLRKEIGFRWK